MHAILSWGNSLPAPNIWVLPRYNHPSPWCRKVKKFPPCSLICIYLKSAFHSQSGSMTWTPTSSGLNKGTHTTFTCIYNLVINIKKIELYIYIYMCTQSVCDLACYFCYLIWSCGESEWGSSSSSYWNTKSKPTKKKEKKNSGTDMRMSSMASELKIYKAIAVYT